ncbi:DUF6498-containing protein [Mycobacterium sp. 236(2023)]|uniref:DUF6498-containing protein n=1 Tax=Mycobacterium sp. 236(2023) TaxID=3038163 RepID=UPI002415512D|nr:DUF6498-containing protein [Mycobacterium sp. 236(2023)]MDG4666702.1 DUF6498-containing protein [Mycobacterium sp. 236(2023)]
MIRLAHLLAALAIIAVPALGWFVDGWSGATTLVVYWFETLAGSLIIAARIMVHRRWAPKRGHYRYVASATTRRSPSSSSFAAGFLMTSLIFTAVHGLFLAAIVFLLGRNGQPELAEINWRSVGYGCAAVVAFMCVDFAVDLLSLRRWSFWQIEQTAQRGFSRVVVVHLTLIFGMFGVAITGASSALFGVFVVLKSLASLSFVLPQWEPARPPRWLSRVMNRVPNVHPGERFEDFWAKDRDDERARRERNEEHWEPTRR